jgi:uncharacterized YccA/Bax inhibitor family protein
MTTTEKIVLAFYLSFLATISLGSIVLAFLNWETVTTDASGILGGAIALGVGVPLVGMLAAFRDIQEE